MNDDHRVLRESLGAYALGGLDADDRAAVEAHLANCPPCREQLAAFAPLPGLLQQVDEVPSSIALPGHLSDQVMAEIGAAKTVATRRLRLWQTLAAAACVALVAVLVLSSGLFEQQREGTPLALQSLAPDAQSIQGEATAWEWAWGTTIQLDLTDLPDRDSFQVVAVDDQSQQQAVGGWTATEGHAVRWRGGSGIATTTLTQVLVTDGAGQVVLTLTPTAE